MNEHAKRPPRPATYQDVIDAPPHMTAQIVAGALHLHPRPAFRHAVASSVLGSELLGSFQRGRGGPGGWWIVDEPELHLGDDVLVPDLAGWRRERMPTPPDGPWSDVVPDWACEVLSPGTRSFDLTDKREAYARHGLAHLWLVDPKARTLEAFALREGTWVLVAALKDAEEVRVPPFEAVAFPLSALWGDPD
ncbi:Uma2 family endonuclease [Amaricoccus sp.]|uniref:Uma2 family endonuclease n=1 Tax=Amaricoccus sp. TaxID=1872485 RepID=UPI001B4977E3|nr:Uma2 family endonuclease [Amaricoccus sp.]MBP7001797.1 Uma2 family endonuclease [Amaricoccus sp.]